MFIVIQWIQILPSTFCGCQHFDLVLITTPTIIPIPTSNSTAMEGTTTPAAIAALLVLPLSPLLSPEYSLYFACSNHYITFLLNFNTQDERSFHLYSMATIASCDSVAISWAWAVRYFKWNIVGRIFSALENTLRPRVITSSMSDTAVFLRGIRWI